MTGVQKATPLPLISSAQQLETLQRAMSARILRLETAADNLEDHGWQRLLGAYIYAAIVLRDLLLRVWGVLDVVPGAVPSFEEMLAEALVSAYQWAVADLAEMHRIASGQVAEGPRSLPLEALSVFHDLAKLCASSSKAASEPLVTALRNIDDALYQLIEVRHRLEWQRRQSSAMAT